MKIVKNTLLVLALGVTAVSASNLLATVNGTKITSDDAERFVRSTNPKQTFKAASDDDKKKIVDRLIERVLFLGASKKDGTENDPEYIKAIKIAKDELLINQWMRKQYNNTVVSDGEAKEFYEKNKKQFQEPAQVHARHILFKTDEKAAKEVIKELSGLSGDKLKEKFIELAKSKSEGPSGKSGGDLGFFSKGQMVAPFSKAAFALEKGAITKEPIKTQFGYHVIYVEDKKAPVTVAYDKVKDKIIQTLKQQQFRDMLIKSAKELKAKAKIVMPEAKK